MDDPETVMAVAAIVSAVFALAALIVSIVGLVRSVSASKDAQNAREKATGAQWKMSEHLEAIAEAQARALERGGQPAGGVGGKLSARLVSVGRGDRLIIANVGTQALTVEDIGLDHPNVLVHGATESVIGAELEPGEDLSMIAGLTLGTKLPLTVTLRWRDSGGETHERVQRVTTL